MSSNSLGPHPRVADSAEITASQLGRWTEVHARYKLIESRLNRTRSGFEAPDGYSR
jgi:hypothetical protein